MLDLLCDLVTCMKTDVYLFSVLYSAEMFLHNIDIFLLVFYLCPEMAETIMIAQL